MSVAVGRRYGEPVDVRRRDDEPAEFLWRGRLYLVRAVLARWWEAGGWWQAGPAEAAVGSAGSGGAAGFAGPDDREREVWRVEAGAGSTAGTGLYDLSFDWAAGGWTLARVLD